MFKTTTALGAALLFCLVSGCFNAGVTPRTGDLLPQGQFGGGGTIAVATVAPVDVTHSSGVRDSGNGGNRVLLHPLLSLALPLISTQAGLRYGALDWLEIVATLGYLQMGGGVRLGILQERRGQGVSLALALESMWRPSAKLNGAWSSTSLELSRTFGRVSPFVDIAASYGPEDYAFFGSKASSGCEDGSCYDEYGPGAHYRISRRELRLHSVVGIEINTHEEIPEMVFAIQPYFTLYSDDDSAALVCENCGSTEVADFESAGWGVSLTLGFWMP
ncbi:MAG: hypothetical protein KC561_17135 [Myxococcales bacterium]|nr:hypothetical protein [Myxococcales bacterium]